MNRDNVVKPLDLATRVRRNVRIRVSEFLLLTVTICNLSMLSKQLFINGVRGYFILKSDMTCLEKLIIVTKSG